MDESNLELVEIEATVQTGLEEIAKEDVEEKLIVKNLTSSRGKLVWNMLPIHLKSCLDLRCVDHLSVIFYHDNSFNFVNREEEDLKLLEELVPKINWKSGLQVWQMFSKFEYEMPDKSSSEPGMFDSEKVKLELKVPSFRATCYRSGGKHSFGSPEAARAFGGAIQDYFGWEVKMKEYDINVVLTIEGVCVSVGIALTVKGLHLRSLVEFGPTSLRADTAYMMLRLCDIQPGSVVVDPMCGGGSIPLEGTLQWKNSVFCAGDNHEKAIPRCEANLANIKRCQPNSDIQLLYWDVTKLPFRDESVDVFVSDLPFGKKSGRRMDNRGLYPSALLEMARVARHSTGRAVLLTHDKRCMVDSLRSCRRYWNQVQTVWLGMGGLNAHFYVLKRTKLIYELEEQNEEPQN